MTFFGTRFLGSYSSDLHQTWYTASLYDHLGYDMFFLIRPRSHFITFLSLLWDLEKFRAMSAPDGYTIYVGLRSNLACSLEMTWN